MKKIKKWYRQSVELDAYYSPSAKFAVVGFVVVFVIGYNIPFIPAVIIVSLCSGYFNAIQRFQMKAERFMRKHEVYLGVGIKRNMYELDLYERTVQLRCRATHREKTWFYILFASILVSLLLGVIF